MIQYCIIIIIIYYPVSTIFQTKILSYIFVCLEKYDLEFIKNIQERFDSLCLNALNGTLMNEKSCQVSSVYR